MSAPTYYDFVQDGGYTSFPNLVTGLTGASGLGGMTAGFGMTKIGNFVSISWAGFSWSEASGLTGPAITTTNVVPAAFVPPNNSYFSIPVLAGGSAANGTVLVDSSGTMVFYNANQTNFGTGSNGVFAGGIGYNQL